MVHTGWVGWFPQRRSQLVSHVSQLRCAQGSSIYVSENRIKSQELTVLFFPPGCLSLYKLTFVSCANLDGCSLSFFSPLNIEVFTVRWLQCVCVWPTDIPAQTFITIWPVHLIISKPVVYYFVAVWNRVPTADKSNKMKPAILIDFAFPPNTQQWHFCYLQQNTNHSAQFSITCRVSTLYRTVHFQRPVCSTLQSHTSVTQETHCWGSTCFVWLLKGS